MPEEKARKHLRMQGWDFTSPGGYFITISTRRMHAAFGTVVEGRMVLNDAGKIADAFWREIPLHFPHVLVDEHVVMPDHVHGLLLITACRDDMERVHSPTACRGGIETACRGGMEGFGKPVAGSIPTVIRSYKGAVTRAMGHSVWQPRFYEVRARDERARDNIRQYIRDNPANYHALATAEPQYVGDKRLLDRPKVAFLASRGCRELPRMPSLKPDEVIVSTFLSPMERAVFQQGLREGRPMIWVNPTACRGVNGPTPWRGGIETPSRGVLEIFPFPSSRAPNARRASWCNAYALSLADRIVVGHLNPEGMLACILSEVDPEKDITQL